MPTGLLLVDKEPGWTSHDVVAKCRSLLGERRIGHGGTLDPMATGLLVLFVGRATRALPYLPGDKTYLARLRFGLETDTQDITGRVLAQGGPIPSREALCGALPLFTGRLEQTPPMVSAVKVGGRRLYELARRGVEIERAPRPVTVRSLSLTGGGDGEYGLEIRCSAGTYVRTLIRDIGRSLGAMAVMTELRRVESGPFSVSGAVPPPQVTRERLLPLDVLFASYPAVTVPAGYEAAVRNGGSFPWDGPASEALVRVYDGTGAFLMLGRAGGGRILTEKSFFEIA